MLDYVDWVLMIGRWDVRIQDGRTLVGRRVGRELDVYRIFCALLFVEMRRPVWFLYASMSTLDILCG